MLYKITEKFYSVQGEGFWAGTPTYFLRLTGCNLNCDFCDTVQRNTVNEELTEQQIFEAACKECKNRRLTITGGEPTLQELGPLVTLFKNNDWYIAIETNGTNINAIPAGIDWVTVSPKPKVDYSKLSIIHGNELKVVMDGVIDPAKFRSTNFDHFFIQPCSENFKPAAEFVLANPGWRLSVQIHKVIGVL